MENLTRTTVSGLRWTYGAVAISAVMQLGYTAIMGRLLPPAAFGLVAMAQVFLQLGERFARLGVGPALIQKPDLTDRDVRCGFTSSVVLGLLFAGLLWTLAPLAGRLYDDPEVVPLVRVLSVSFLVNGAGLTAMHMLRRRLRFRAVAVVQVVSYGFGYLLIGVTSALLGAGVWSLVAASLGQVTMQGVLSHALARIPVKPLVSWPELRRLYGYGSRVTLNGFLEYLGDSLPTYVVGRFAGQRALGLLDRADLVVSVPLSHATTGLGKVLMPTFSAVQDDRTRLARGYFSAVGVAAAILIPLGSGIAVAAPELIRFILGPQWDEAARLVPFLAVTGVCAVLSQFGGILCDATATLNRKLVLQLTFLTALGAGLAMSVGQDLVVYVMVIAAAEVFRHAMYVAVVGHVTGIGYLRHLRLYVRPAVTGALVAGGILAVTGWLHGAAAPLAVVVVAQVGTGAVVLASSVWWGPMVPFKHELRRQLAATGVSGSDSPGGRLVDRLLSFGR